MDAAFTQIFNYVGQVILITLTQLVIMFAPGIALALGMQFLATTIQRLAYRTLGRGLFLGLFGWLGTTVHELGHLVFLLIFGHQIVEVQFFNPDPYAPQLGYVNARYDPNSVYQNIGKFFAGIGPILFGTLLIYLAARLLLDPTSFARLDMASSIGGVADQPADIGALTTAAVEGAWAFATSLLRVDYLLDWHWYAFLYLAFAIGSSIRLSPADIQGATSGFLTILGLMLLFNLATLWMADATATILGMMSTFYGFFYAITSIAPVMNLLALLLLFLPAVVLSGRR